jgi:protein SPT2
MSHFKALMALSRSQTQETQSKVNAAMAQRQRNEALKRKYQEEYERREREREKVERDRHFEKQKLEKERLEQLERERQGRLAELARREEEQREALRYGPKKSKSASGATSDGSSHRQPSSSSSSSSNGTIHDESRKRHHRTSGEIDDGESSAPVLTREEKRQRKLQAEWRESASPRKRSSHSHKSGGRLPGGAINVTEISRNSSVGTLAGAQSVKERLAAMPMTLTMLNVVKRDVRTIDEILQDRAKAREEKVLDGDQARGFHDWFGASKKKESLPKSNSASLPVSRTGTPVAGASAGTHLCRPIFNVFFFEITS